MKGGHNQWQPAIFYSKSQVPADRFNMGVYTCLKKVPLISKFAHVWRPQLIIIYLYRSFHATWIWRLLYEQARQHRLLWRVTERTKTVWGQGLHHWTNSLQVSFIAPLSISLMWVVGNINRSINLRKVYLWQSVLGLVEVNDFVVQWMSYGLKTFIYKRIRGKKYAYLITGKLF